MQLFPKRSKYKKKKETNDWRICSIKLLERNKSNKSDHTNSEDKWIRTQTVGSHSDKIEYVCDCLGDELLIHGAGKFADG